MEGRTCLYGPWQQYICIYISNRIIQGKRQTNEIGSTRVTEALKQEARGARGNKRQAYNLMSKNFKIKSGETPFKKMSNH